MATRTVDGKPALWTDTKGVTHAAEGDWLTPRDFCLWTVCGSADVPANRGYHPGPGDAVTCPTCIKALAEEEDLARKILGSSNGRTPIQKPMLDISPERESLMRIVAVAIRVNGLILSKPAPARHCHILNAMPKRMARASLPSDQGFLSNTGIFLGREDALNVARAAGQLKKETHHKELFSEDLW